MSQQSQARVLWSFLGSMLMVLLRPLRTSPIDISPLVAIIKETASKEHPEDIVRVKIVFVVEPLVVPLIESFFGAVLIVHPSLFLVAEAGKGLTYLFEGFGGLGSFVFVGVEFES